MASLGVRIALVGKISSGKTTCARIVSEKKGSYSVALLSLGSQLKKTTNELFPSPSNNPDFKARDKICEVAEKMREIDPDVWVNCLLRALDNVPSDTVCIVDDVRQHNEYTALKNAGFLFIRLNIDRETQKRRIAEKYGQDAALHESFIDHPTEHEVIDYDRECFLSDVDASQDENKVALFLCRTIRIQQAQAECRKLLAELDQTIP